MKRLSILILILVCFALKGQILKPTSVGIGFGVGSNDYQKDTDLVFIQNNFSSVPEFNQDLRGFNQQDYRKAFLRQLGFSIGVNFSFRDSITKRRKNPTLKVDAGFIMETVISGFVVKRDFKGTGPGVIDTLKTQSLSYSVNSTLFHTGAAALFSTKYFEEFFRVRFFGGIGFQLGLASQRIAASFKKSTIMATENSAAGTYSTVGNAISETKHEGEYKSNTPMFNSRLLFPIGIEMTEASNSFTFFAEIDLGVSYYQSKNMEAFTGSQNYTSFGIRYVIPSSRQ